MGLSERWKLVAEITLNLYRIGLSGTIFLGIGNTAERSYGGIGAVKINRNNGILDEAMAEQHSKDIKYIVAVIGEGKRMDGSVEINDHKH